MNNQLYLFFLRIRDIETSAPGFREKLVLDGRLRYVAHMEKKSLKNKTKL